MMPSPLNTAHMTDDALAAEVKLARKYVKAENTPNDEERAAWASYLRQLIAEQTKRAAKRDKNGDTEFVGPLPSQGGKANGEDDDKSSGGGRRRRRSSASSAASAQAQAAADAAAAGEAEAAKGLSPNAKKALTISGVALLGASAIAALELFVFKE